MKNHPLPIKVILTVLLFFIVPAIIGLISTFMVKKLIISHELQLALYILMLGGLFYGIYKAIKFIWY